MAECLRLVVDDCIVIDWPCRILGVREVVGSSWVVRFGLVAALEPELVSIVEFGIGAVGKLQVIEVKNITESSFTAMASSAIEQLVSY